MIDLSGKWTYREEFDYGYVSGYISLTQTSDTLAGTAILTEHQDSDPPLEVRQDTEGIVVNNTVTFKSINFNILSHEKDIEFYLDSWEGMVNTEGAIIGNSIDQSGACGIFIMKRPAK